MQVINLDQYFELKEKKVIQLFIFFLNSEYPHLNTSSTWLHSLKYPSYIVRMNNEEFDMMDMAIHPKILCTKGGKELFEINGIPTLNYLKFQIQNRLKSI